MSYFEETVAAFRAELGMRDAPVDPSAPSVFRFEHGERLFIEQREEKVLVYFEDPAPGANEAMLIAALQLCDIRRRNALPVRTGLASNDRLVFAVSFEDTAFTLQTLHQSLELMRSLQRQVTQ